MSNKEYYKKVEELIIEALGLDKNSLGEKTIHRTIDFQIKHNNIDDIENYYNQININKELFNSLLEQLVVAETWFFRDKQPFIFLKEHIKSYNSLSRQGKIRILSVPCSTGEEPYSIAITLIESGLKFTQFQIDALDISEAAINAAKQGIYTKSSFREKIDFIDKYFEQVEDKFHLNNELFKQVNFYKCNIFSSTSLLENKTYDIIFCRNLLIYLNERARIALLDILKKHLDSNGILFVGHSETHLLKLLGFKSVNHPKSFAFRNVAHNIDKSSKAIKKNEIINRKDINKSLQQLRSITQLVVGSDKIQKESKSIQTEELLDNDINKNLLDDIKKLADNGNLLEAKDKCQKYIKQNSTEPDAYYIYGLINQGLNNINFAIENYEKALYLDPHHYESMIVLSLLFESKGDLVKANLLKERANRL